MVPYGMGGLMALSMNFPEWINDGGFMDLAPRCPPVIVTHSGIVVSAAIGFAALFLVASNGMR